MKGPLAREVEIAARVREQVVAIDPDDQDLLHDTIEGETRLLDMLSGLARKVREADAMQDAITGMIKDMAVRRNRFASREEGLRKVIAWAMQEAGIIKHEAPDLTLSISAARPSVAITDEFALPQSFMRVSYAPDRDKIKAAVMAGDTIPGAVLNNGAPALVIRSR